MDRITQFRPRDSQVDAQVFYTELDHPMVVLWRVPTYDLSPLENL